MSRLTLPVGCFQIQMSSHNIWTSIPCLFQRLGYPNIYPSASRLSPQVSKYVSSKPDTHASHIDVFTLSCKEYNLMYLFPAFSLILMRVRRLFSRDAYTFDDGVQWAETAILFHWLWKYSLLL